MTDFEYDLVVIGAGSGGVRAARVSANLGARVAIVEGRFFGGTCVNVGCVPKKMFAYAAEFSGLPALAADFGYAMQLSRVDWRQLRANKDREIERLNGIYRKLLHNAGVEIVEGYGSVTGPHAVRVGERELTARHILIATGGKPFVPPVEGRELALVSDDLFVLEELPRRVAVVGGGYIASEFASILHGLGCHVHQLYRGPLFLRGFDEDVRRFVAQRMRDSGIDLRFDSDVQRIQEHEGGRRLTLMDGSLLDVDAVFYATGRLPNLDGLLDGVGLSLTDTGAIEVDETFRTSVNSIYAVGDVIDRIPLTPVALAEGMWLSQHLFGDAPAEPLAYDAVPSAVFCHPNIATVGLTEQDALARFGRLRVYRSDFRPLRHTLGESRERTFMKLIVDDATDRVLGLHMAGEEAAEIMQGFAVAVRMGATKADFDRTIGIHPTAAEEFVTLRQAVVVEPEA